jgi:hypothetical protein
MAMFFDMLETGRHVAEAVRPYLDFLASRDGMPTLALGLLAVAALSGLLFILCCVLPLRWSLWRPTQMIRGTENYHDFAAHFTEVALSISNSRVLRPAWHNFRAALIFPDVAADERKVIRNAVRPQEYFNLQNAGYRFSVLRGVPPALILLGLFLSLLGLIATLHVAGQANGWQSDFFSRASLSLYPTAAGLAASLLLSLLIRCGVEIIESGFDAFSHALEARMVRITLASITDVDKGGPPKPSGQPQLSSADVARSLRRGIEESLNDVMPRYIATVLQPIESRLAEISALLSPAAKPIEDPGEPATPGFRGFAEILQDLKKSLDEKSD